MSASPTIAVIVVAAGVGTRAAEDGDTTPKQFRPIAGVPMLARTLVAMLEVPAVGRVLPVLHADHADRYAYLKLTHERLMPPVVGGADRQASVLAGLQALAADPPDLVLIQDAARPLVTPAVVDAVIAALAEHDGALPVVPVTDTIKRSADGHTVSGTEDRATLFSAQTPQGFHFAPIYAAHQRAAAAGGTFTDDAAIAEWAGLSVALTPGSTNNIKVTRPEDFAAAARMLREDVSMETRIGTGFDVHPFSAGDHVTLGGVKIAHSHALQGHSDADAALHAVTDAIYGALGAGDIGVHFPPSDMQWKGAASTVFLQHAAAMVAARGGRIVNLDITIICEAPRIGPHVEAMRQTIGAACGISANRVAVKATTSEKLGFTGREEGIAALASASIEVPRGE